MNSTPKATEPHDALSARTDERLARAHEQIVRADEQLARLSEQVARMERNAARASSAGRSPQSRLGKPALRILIGLPLVACIVAAALVLQSSYGDGARLVFAVWSPQLASSPSLPPQNPPSPAELALPAVQVAAAEAAPQQTAPSAQTTPQDAAPIAAAALPDHTQLLQTMVRDLANVERSIEQLKATQQKMASDTAKDIAELKASQEEIKRVLARVSEQSLLSRTSPPQTSPPQTSPPQTSPPQTQPTATLRKPEPTARSPRARARPRIRREWIYDDDW